MFCCFWYSEYTIEYVTNPSHSKADDPLMICRYPLVFYAVSLCLRTRNINWNTIIILLSFLWDSKSLFRQSRDSRRFSGYFLRAFSFGIFAENMRCQNVKNMLRLAVRKRTEGSSRKGHWKGHLCVYSDLRIKKHWGQGLGKSFSAFYLLWPCVWWRICTPRTAETASFR